MPATYVALDLGTTGLDPSRDEIIEIGLVRFDDERELDALHTLIHPGRPIPADVTELTGISDQDVVTAPPLSAVRGRVARFVGDSILVGHDVGFHLRFLNRYGLFQEQPHIDTVELATILMPEQQRYGLDSLALSLELDAGSQHRALDGARTTASLLRALQERANQLPFDTLRRINHAAEAHAWPPKAIFLQAEKRRREVAGERLGPGRGSSGAVVLDEPSQYEPLIPVDERTVIDIEALTKMLEPGGALERAFPGFEYRSQQVEMMQSVAEAFNHSLHLIVEAGTGTGKSIAYLLPAIHWAIQNGERVVVSTNTINLQDQLYGKDIPDLRALFPFEVRATVLKGRGNYLCPRRLEALESKGELTLDELRVLVKVLVWLPATATGDRAELSMYDAEEWSVWSRISSDSDMCTAARCWHRRRGTCYYQRARRLAESAHIVVVNHALLLSDVVTENSVLPPYGYLVVDEAHHLEDATTNQLGYSVARWTIESLIVQTGLRGRFPGGFTTQVWLHCQGRIADELVVQLEERIEALHACNESVLRGVRELFEDLASFVAEYKDTPGIYDYRIRLTRDLRIQPAWERIELSWDGVSEEIRSAEAELDRLIEVLRGLEGAGIPGYEDLVQEGVGLLQQLETMQQQTETIVLEPEPGTVTWVQSRARSDEVFLCAVPLRVGHLVEQHLLWEKEAVIFTSATLRTNGDFSYIRERLGAVDAEELAVGSPFDYESQVLLYLPTDMPEPNEPYHQARLNQALIDLALAIGGRTLVLFTSYRQLYATYNAIHYPLSQRQVTVYAQGHGTSRSQLLERFRTTPRAVLLGTRSFWEGVDVPGEALSCLVVTKLPFSVPTDPVFAARSAEMDDPFVQYAVPDAILRFRQGFGRLIRTRSDRGVVVVTDVRVQTKGYGPMFIDSLPKCTTVQAPLADLAGQATKWLAREPVIGEGKQDEEEALTNELEYVPFDELFDQT
jgi:predicted DnaQ family exonuclease/DinG family helicase